MLPLAFHFAQGGLLLDIERFTFCLGKPISQLWLGHQAMDMHRKLCHGLRARFSAATGHDGGLVPTNDGRQMIKVRNFFRMFY
ncbi:Uncharacterised protein [Vibrio cholerae]|nr:Uncharacterised protein [Vibrio cholerae]